MKQCFQAIEQVQRTTLPEKCVEMRQLLHCHSFLPGVSRLSCRGRACLNGAGQSPNIKGMRLLPEQSEFFSGAGYQRGDSCRAREGPLGVTTHH